MQFSGGGCVDSAGNGSGVGAVDARVVVASTSGGHISACFRKPQSLSRNRGAVKPQQLHHVPVMLRCRCTARRRARISLRAHVSQYMGRIPYLCRQSQCAGGAALTRHEHASDLRTCPIGAAGC